MRKAALVLAVAGVFLFTAAAAPARSIVAGEMSGIVPAKGIGKARRSSALLLWHNGEIMTSTSVTPIFWGPSWGSYSGDKMTGIDSFYSSVGGTSYLGTTKEFYGTNGSVGTGVTANAHLVDTSSLTFKTQPQVSDILNEVARKIANPAANGYYPVYVDLPRGHVGYCAWHSYGTIDGTPVTIGFFYNLDGDTGCDPEDTFTDGHSQGLAALGNVSGHEISETVTDPRNGGWWDTSGAENADKCAWTFSGKPVKLGATTWKTQGNFSNNAYNAKTGYDRAGCIDGQ